MLRNETRHFPAPLKIQQFHSLRSVGAKANQHARLHRCTRADLIKEEIGWLKVVFAVCVALDASLVAWLAQNYVTAHPLMIIIGCVAALVLAVVVVYVNRRAYRRIQELEDT